jgi:hypothetical protein
LGHKLDREMSNNIVNSIITWLQQRTSKLTELESSSSRDTVDGMRALIARSLASLVGKRPKASTSAFVSIGAYGFARNVDP